MTLFNSLFASPPPSVIPPWRLLSHKSSLLTLILFSSSDG